MITFEPMQLIQWAAFILTAIALGYWAFSALTENLTDKAKVVGILGCVFLVCGVVSCSSRLSAQGEIAQKTAFTQVPQDWQEFFNHLKTVPDELKQEAIERFVHKNPSHMTTDAYMALIGKHYWVCASDHEANRAHNALKVSPLVEDFVLLFDEEQ